MGCALSHMKLWEALVADDSHSFYVIFEDDITISTEKPFFSDIQASLVVIRRLLDALPSWDVVMLGYSRLDDKTPYRSDRLFIEALSSDYVGGTFGYIIHKKAAAFLLGTIRYTGIYLPIDNLMTSYYFEKRFLNFFQLSSDLVATEWFRHDDPSYKDIDTDIQKDDKTIVFYNQSDFATIEDATFFKNKEHRPIDMIHLVGIVAHVDKYVACCEDTLFSGVSVPDLVHSPLSKIVVMKNKIIDRYQRDLAQKFQVAPHFRAKVLFTVRGGDHSFLQHLVIHHPEAIGYTYEGHVLADGEDVFADAMVPSSLN
jgi:GR25 family glycosyltransferase involved in LPS biosynthesis